MRPPKGSPIRILKVKDTDDLKTIYAKVKRTFTAADLARYANEEEMFPFEDLLKDLEAIQRDESRRPRKKKNQ